MKQKKRINGKMHCGSCRHFKNEDINGDGWCEKIDLVTHCSTQCTYYAKKMEDEHRTDRR